MNEIEQIKQELLKLNFNVNSKGILYWIKAIEIIKEYPLKLKMTEIYEDIAKIYNTTYSRVERGMRTAIEPAKKNIQNEYGYYKKICNSTFLELIRFKII